MTRYEMTEFIVKHHGGNADPSVIRQYLGKETEDQVRERYQHLLQGERQRIVSNDPETVKAEQAAVKAQADAAQALKDYRWTALCAHNFGGRSLANVQSNRNFVEGWALGQPLTPAWLERVLNEDPKAKSQLSWISYIADTKAHDAQVEAQTRATFSSLARDYDLSRCESNVQAILGHFPDGVDSFQMGIAIQNHELSLAPCSKAEHLEYTKELEAEYASKWKALPLHEMRKRSAECNAEREALLARHSWKERGVLTKADEAEARQQAIKAQEELLGYPVMPEFIGETKLDAVYLRGCSRSQLTDCIRRFGAFQTNQRLVGK